MHRGTEYHACRRHRRDELVGTRLGRIVHRGPWLRPEVLDDDLLEVAVPPMNLAKRQERLRSLPRGFADPDQDARRERDRETPRVLDRSQAHPRHLVGGAEVRSSAGGEPVRRRLQHDSHRRAHVLEARHLLPRHHAGIEVRQQSGLLDHADRYRAQVVQRRGVSAFVQPRARCGITLLGAGA